MDEKCPSQVLTARGFSGIVANITAANRCNVCACECTRSISVSVKACAVSRARCAWYARMCVCGGANVCEFPSQKCLQTAVLIAASNHVEHLFGRTLSISHSIDAVHQSHLTRLQSDEQNLSNPNGASASHASSAVVEENVAGVRLCALARLLCHVRVVEGIPVDRARMSDRVRRRAQRSS